MLRSATLQPNAFPARTAISTAARFSAGSAPGRPRHTGHTCVLGGAPNAVEQEQKILLWVSSCACTSSPMTGSQSWMLMAPPGLAASGWRLLLAWRSGCNQRRELARQRQRSLGGAREAKQRSFLEGPSDELHSNGKAALREP